MNVSEHGSYCSRKRLIEAELVFLSSGFDTDITTLDVGTLDGLEEKDGLFGAELDGSGMEIVKDNKMLVIILKDNFYNSRFLRLELLLYIFFFNIFTVTGEPLSI